jgi:hypothetical protein
MADLNATPGLDSVPQLEKTDIIIAGPGGRANAQAQALLNRMEGQRIGVHVRSYGGDLKRALQEVPEYTTIHLDAAHYDISGLYSNDFNLGAGPFLGNQKRGIRLQGAGMPRVSADGTALEGGTVILGTLFNLANDFEVYDLGVDVGLSVCTNLYGGAFAEGFVAGANTSYPTPQPTIKGFKCNRVIALGNAPTESVATWKHTVLLENLEGPKIGSMEAVGGYHAFVDKCVDLQASNITVRGGSGDSIQFNTNEANRCERSQYGNFRVGSWFLNGVEQKAGPIVYYSNNAAAPFTSGVKIGVLTVRNTQPGIDLFRFDGNGQINDCGIGHLDADLGSNSGALFRAGYGTASVNRFVIGTHNIKTGGRGFELGGNSLDCEIGSGIQVFNADALNPLLAFDSLRYKHGDILMIVNAAQSAQSLVRRPAGECDVRRISFGGSAAPTPAQMFSTPSNLLTTNSNAVASGVPAFKTPAAVYRPYIVELQGVLKMAAAGSNIQIGTVSIGPQKNQQVVVPVQTSGGSRVFRTLEFQSGGLLVMIEPMAVNDYVFLDRASFDLLP